MPRGGYTRARQTSSPWAPGFTTVTFDETAFAPDGMTAEWTTPERCLEMYRADYETIGAVIRSMNLELQ